jgi:hypothetical protein
MKINRCHTTNHILQTKKKRGGKFTICKAENRSSLANCRTERINFTY